MCIFFKVLGKLLVFVLAR